MITHSDDGPFWSVVKRGMEAAGEDLGVTVVWSPSVNDPNVQVQLIEQAIAEGSDGIAASLPSPDQLVGPLQTAVGAGVPGDHAQLRCERLPGDRRAHPRRPDRDHRRSRCRRALQRTRRHQGPLRQSRSSRNVALEERCQGLANTFSGEVVTEFVGLDADQTEQQNTINAALQADPDIDGFMGTGPVIAMSGLRAAQDLGRGLSVGGFDITPEIIDAIEAGDVAFTVDQQQYLQGYLPILLLYLNVTNQNTAGWRSADPHRSGLRHAGERR